MRSDDYPSAISRDRPVSYNELKRHSSYDDAWISVNGTIYDITRFIDRHPFGDTFRGHLGTECGGLFSSAHSMTNVEALLKSDRFLAESRISIVGRLTLSGDRLHKHNTARYLDRIVYKDTGSDAFWNDLKGRVTCFLRENNEVTHYSNGEGIAYIIYYALIYLALSYLTWGEASNIAAVLLGVHMICANAHIAHMATHHGFTRSRPLNAVAMHFFDLSGISGLEWQITHDTHHNQPHSSIDHQTNAYGYIGARIHKFEPHRGFQRFQKFYFWISVSPYLVFKFFATTIWLFRNADLVRYGHEIAGHALARIILLALFAYGIYAHGFWTAFLLFGLYSISFSQTAFILLFNDYEDTHSLFEDSKDVDAYQRKLSWAEVQVRTSNDWYPTNWLLAFIEFHYGYFNYHIEHHLFPTYKASVLKKISPIVRETCADHDIPYLSMPFAEVQASLFRHLARMGMPSEETAGHFDQSPSKGKSLT